MNKAVIKKNHFLLFRVCLLNCVLTGLLFSCGEGIRLLPFPATETTKNNSSQLNVKDKILYQYNVHRFEERQGNQKTKSQHNYQNHYWIKDGYLHHSEPRLLTAQKKIVFPSSFENLKLPLFSKSGASRAPPFLI